MALEIKNVKNCFANYLKYRRYNKKWLYIGYLEACLVQFEVIESKDNGLADYTLLKPNGREENREEVIVRLTQQFINSQKSKNDKSI